MDQQVLQAHEAATNALKTCREAQGLTVERVEDTLDALAEASRLRLGLACFCSNGGNATIATCCMLPIGGGGGVVLMIRITVIDR